MFIELTDDRYDTKTLINIKSINNVFETGDRANIDGVFYKESYKQVKEMIKQEVAAERGY